MCQRGEKPWNRRLVVRAVALILAVSAIFGIPAVWLRFGIPACSPFIGLVSAVASRSFTIATICSVPMLVVMVLKRRWFCRYLCPLGLMVETCGMTKPTRLPHARIPPIGQWLALATAGGAVFGWPLFLWLDPLAILSGGIGAASMVCAVPLILVVVSSLIFPNLWCLKLCPLGGTQELLSQLRGLVAADKGEAPGASRHAKGRRAFLGLTAGGAIAALIPRVLPRKEPPLRPPGALAENAFERLCVRCGNCVRSCPSEIVRQDTSPPDLAGLLAPKLNYSSNYCREDCNACTRSCPSGAIRAMNLKQKNRHKIGLARIHMPDCYLATDRECSACVISCPYDAIIDAFDRESYTTVLRVDPERCNGCGNCVLVCPPKVITVAPVTAT